MKIVKNDNTVLFNYMVKLHNGKLFGDYDKARLVKCNMSDKNLIPGLFDGLLGMEAGQKKEFYVEKERGFGDIKQDRIRKFSKNILEGNEVEKGSIIQLKDREDNILKPIVLDKDDETVTLDFNHPLAGKDLIFEVEIVEIQ